MNHAAAVLQLQNSKKKEKLSGSGLALRKSTSDMGRNERQARDFGCFSADYSAKGVLLMGLSTPQ